MDKTTAFGDALQAVDSAIRAAKALLPDNVWGDNPDIDRRDAADQLQQVLGLSLALRCPYNAERVVQGA